MDNILHELLEATDTLPEKSMIMLSMDGQNANLKVYENLKSHRAEKNFPKLLMLVRVDYIQTGIKANGWKLEKYLKAMWKLFNDSPARRNPYIQLNISDFFPLIFC